MQFAPKGMAIPTNSPQPDPDAMAMVGKTVRKGKRTATVQGAVGGNMVFLYWNDGGIGCEPTTALVVVE